MKKFKQKSFIIVLIVLIGIYLFLGVYYPISSIIVNIFSEEGINFEVITEIFTSERILKSLENTILMSVFTVVCVNILAFFQIAVTEIFEIKFAKIFKCIFLVPMIFNGILLVVGYDFLYSSNGIFTKSLIEIFPNMNADWFEGFFAVLIVHSFSMTIYHQFFVSDALKLVDNSIIETAKSLGTSKIKIITKVILPMLLPSIFSSSIFVFVSSLASNSAPTFLGGKDFYMISQSIKSFNSIGYQNIASILSITLGIISILPIIITKRVEKRKRFFNTTHVNRKMEKIKIKHKSVKVILYIIAIAISIIYLLPVLICIIYSFGDINSIYMKEFPNSFSFNNYLRVFSSTDILQPIINSLRLSFFAIILGLFIAVGITFLREYYKNKIISILENTLLIVWFLPPIIFAIGFILTYNNSMIINIKGDFLLTLGYSLLVVNIMIFSIKSIIKNINVNIFESARILGCSTIKAFFTTIFPLLKQTIFSICSISLITLLSEFTLSELLYSYSNKPLSIVYRAEFTNSTPYQAANILVYTVIVLIISIIILVGVNILNNREKIKIERS